MYDDFDFDCPPVRTGLGDAIDLTVSGGSITELSGTMSLPGLTE